MKRRKFIGILGVGGIALLFLLWTLRNKASLLQKKLSELGFEVEEEETKKFWKAWMEHRFGARGRSWKYYVFICLQYPSEPLDETVRMFLLSSNALHRKDGEAIRFNGLYHPYRLPCNHPFANLQS